MSSLNCYELLCLIWNQDTGKSTKTNKNLDIYLLFGAFWKEAQLLPLVNVSVLF